LRTNLEPEQKLKILIVTAMYPPIRTGTSYYSRNLAEALQSQGCIVQVVTASNPDGNADKGDTTVHRLPAIHIPLKNYFKHLRFCSLYPRNYHSIHNIARELNPDTIILINHYLDIAFLAIHAARKVGCPLYVSIGTQLQSLNKFRNKVLRVLDRLIIGTFVIPYTKRIISWDREIERYIEDVHSAKNAAKSIIIPFGVNGDITRYNGFDNQYADSNQILGVGAVIDHRDYIYQIRVFKKLLELFPNLTLKIIGNVYKDKTVKIAHQLGIEDKVVFTGELPHEQVIQEMQRSMLHWMMINGSYVGLGTSTIEAMLLGVPIVSNVQTDLIGEAKLENMNNYIYSDGQNVDRDVEHISRVIKDRELRRNIGQYGRAFVQQYLNWDLVANKYISYINKDRLVS
jgi:glycosyltransferase involved in cell wall biosynthesis